MSPLVTATLMMTSGISTDALIPAGSGRPGSSDPHCPDQDSAPSRPEHAPGRLNYLAQSR